MIKKILKNATVRNASWLIMGRVAQMAISLVVGIMTARYLGPSDYGLIHYATAYTSFFMSFCTLGLNSVLVKELIDHPNEEGGIIGSSLALRATSSFLSACAIVCLVSILDADDPTAVFVTALCSIGLVFHIFEVFNYWFQAKLRSKVTAIVTLVAYAVVSGYKILLLIFEKSVEWFAFSTALDHLCVGILLFICYKRSGGKSLTFSLAICKRILKRSVCFILPSVMISVYGYADKFMLKHFMSELEVGYYSTATAICGMWCFVLTAVIDSVYPSIMEAHKTDKALFEKRNRQLYALIFYISVTASLLICVFAKPIVRILYGNAYMQAVTPLRVVTWYTAFAYLGVARNAWIVSENKGKCLKYIYVAAAICNVCLNLALIPLWGPSGAAIATLVTQMMTTFVVPFFVRGLRRNTRLMLDAVLLRYIR